MINRAKWFLFILVVVVLTSLFVYQVWSQGVIGANTTVLYALSDTYVNSSSPAANHGSDETLVIQTPEGYAYVKFDLGSIPQGALITSATLSLYLETGSEWSGPFGKAQIGCYYCDGAWNEDILTWLNHPEFATEPTSIFSFGLLVFTGYKSWIVTQDVQTALQGGSLTEVLKFTDGTGTVLFGSRESSHGPKLVVEYSTRPVVNITLQSRQKDAGTSNLGYIKLSDQEFSLPQKLQAVESDHYPIQYMGGYGFESWETTGDLMVSDPSRNPTTITVSGPGTLGAVGNAQTLTYRYDDSTKEENTFGKTGEILAVRFTPIYAGYLKTASLYIPKWYGDPTFSLHVMDDDRRDLTSPLNVTPTEEGWIDVDLTQYNVQIRRDYYIGMEHLYDYRPYLGGDRTDPDPERSWKWDTASWATYRHDYMIRSTIQNNIPLEMIPEHTPIMVSLLAAMTVLLTQKASKPCHGPGGWADGCVGGEWKSGRG